MGGILNCFESLGHSRMDPTNGVPNFFEKDRAMTYKRVAVFDNRGEDLLQHLESCISFIEQVHWLLLLVDKLLRVFARRNSQHLVVGPPKHFFIF